MNHTDQSWKWGDRGRGDRGQEEEQGGSKRGEEAWGLAGGVGYPAMSYTPGPRNVPTLT